MNDPFVVEEARRWGKSVLEEEAPTAGERIEEIYVRAFGRAPTLPEIYRGLAFLHGQSEAYGLSGEEGLGDERVWFDFCHVMFTLKEFIFIA
jgi:hypothetical protein